jgi:two-component system osmolarity sensor histidine kinase EnvZ
MNQARPVALARHYRRWLAALYGVLLAISIGAAMVFVMWPMGQRAADDLAGLMHLSAQTWVELPPETRPAFEEELRRAHRVAIRPDMPAPERTAHWHGFYLLFLERALQVRQGHPVVLAFQAGPDPGEWLWARLDIGGRGIGVGFDYARLTTRPLVALGAMLAAGALLLAGASVWLARRIAQPVERLEQAVAQLARGADPQLLPESGPRELARLAGHFNHMALRVRELLEARTTLLAGVSHDLRTPLARMRLALEMLRLKPDPRLIDRLDADVEAMNGLIGQMLDVARGLDHEPLQAVALTPWLQTRADMHRPAATARASSITVQGPAELNVVVAVGLLGRVVDNLIGNALRYAPGAIEIGASIDAASGDVLIDVADHGPGIAEHQLEAAWRPFERVEASRSPQTGGYGLGLAIVRQIAQSQGWRVQLANRAAGGLLARVAIPRAATP